VANQTFSIHELSENLRRAEARKAELQTQLNKAAEASDKAGQDFMAGSVGADVPVRMANEVIAAETAMRRLDQQIEQIKADLENVKQAEERELRLTELANLAGEGQQALAEFEQARTDLAEAITKYLPRMMTAKQRLRGKRYEFIAAANALTGGALNRLLSYQISPGEETELQRRLGALLDVLKERCDVRGVLMEGLGPKTAADQIYPFPDLGQAGAIADRLFARESGEQAALDRIEIERTAAASSGAVTR